VTKSTQPVQVYGFSVIKYV